jgi:hypothetical protein
MHLELEVDGAVGAFGTEAMRPFFLKVHGYIFLFT